MSEEEAKKSRKIGVAAIIVNVILVILLAVLIAEIVFTVRFDGFYVVHTSMMPTLNGAESLERPGGDYIYVDGKKSPEYGDIVIVYDEAREFNLIKRIVGFGGDTVEFRDGKLYRNDELIEESYIFDEYNTPYGGGGTVYNEYYNFRPHTVADGHMFLVGDNRNVSSDSRDPSNGNNGDYPLSALQGVVPQWALNVKGVSTGWYTFFRFTIRGIK